MDNHKYAQRILSEYAQREQSKNSERSERSQFYVGIVLINIVLIALAAHR